MTTPSRETRMTATELQAEAQARADELQVKIDVVETQSREIDTEHQKLYMEKLALDRGIAAMKQTLERQQ